MIHIRGRHINKVDNDVHILWISYGSRQLAVFITPTFFVCCNTRDPPNSNTILIRFELRSIENTFHRLLCFDKIKKYGMVPHFCINPQINHEKHIYTGNTFQMIYLVPYIVGCQVLVQLKV